MNRVLSVLDGSGRDSVGFSPFGAKNAVQAEQQGDYHTAIGKDISVAAVKGLRLANRNRGLQGCLRKDGRRAMMRPNGSMKPEIPVFAARANAR